MPSYNLGNSTFIYLDNNGCKLEKNILLKKEKICRVTYGLKKRTKTTEMLSYSFTKTKQQSEN